VPPDLADFRSGVPRTGGVKLFLIMLVTGSALAVSPSVGSGVVSHRFENPHLSYTLRIPVGWKATVRREGGVAVVTSLPVPNRNDNPERVPLARGGAYIWISDYGRVRSNGIGSRPAQIQLGEKSSHACGFGEGYMLNFTDHQRLLQIFVKVGPSTDTRSVLAVLNSLQVASLRPAVRRTRVRNH
jgi:hypothetical protein